MLLTTNSTVEMGLGLGLVLTFDCHKFALFGAAWAALVGQLLLLRFGALEYGASLFGTAQLVAAALADQAAIVDRGDNLLAFGNGLAIDLATCKVCNNNNVIFIRQRFKKRIICLLLDVYV